MMRTDMHWLAASEAARLLQEGALSAEEYVGACIARIREEEERVQAWAFFDPEHALEQACRADDRRREGRSLGPLHGIPVGIKDIIDVRGMPTGDGTPSTPATRSARPATAIGEPLRPGVRTSRWAVRDRMGPGGEPP